MWTRLMFEKKVDIDHTLQWYEEKKHMEELTMENESQRPIQGTWDNISSGERKPGIKWEKVGDEHTVTFNADFVQPKEIPYQESVFYVFEVKENGEDKEIATSAWTLLKGLKEQEPLGGKTLKITKEMVAGKQEYKVINLAEAIEEKIN